jgi:glycosyltransferase involved in cell wall biosynthesis
MRICLYTETAVPMLGGQALVVDALARQFVALGHAVVVLAPRQRSAGATDDDALPYTLVRHPRLVSTRWFVGWYGWWLRSLHRRRRFDIVHCHSTYPQGYVAAACRATAGVPLVITSHGSDLDPVSLLYRKPQLRPRYAAALRRADAVVAVSGATEANFRAVCPTLRRVARIPNGVDLARFAADVPRPERLPPSVVAGEYVLFMGRLQPRKGVDLLLDAFAAAARDGALSLVVAGDGSERAALQDRAAALGLDARAQFVGRVEGDAKTWLLRNALCSVIPSRISEAFPLSLLESFAAGRPVVGTRIPGLEELIDPQRTGLLVAPDAVGELARAIGALTAGRAQAESMGRAAQRAARGYDWQVIAQRHLELFAELIAGQVARRAA